MALNQYSALSSTGTDHIIRMFDLSSGETVRTFERLDSDCSILEYLNETYLLAISDKGTLYIIEIASAKTIFKQTFDFPIRKFKRLNNNSFLLNSFNKIYILEINPEISIKSMELWQDIWRNDFKIIDFEWDLINKIFNIVTIVDPV